MAGILEYLQSMGLTPEQFLPKDDEDQGLNYSPYEAPKPGMGDLKQMDESDLQSQLSSMAPTPGPGPGMAGIQAQAMQGATSIQGDDTPIIGRGPKPAAMMPQGPSAPAPDFSAFSPQALQGAQEEARQRRLGTGILGSLSDAVSTMTGTHPDSETWKNLMAQANSPVDDLQAQQKNIMGGAAARSSQLDLQNKQEMDDPNSPVAKAYKDAVKKFLPQVSTDGMSGTQLSQLLQKVSPMVDAQAKMQSALATREYTRQTRAANDDKKAVSEMYNKAQQTQSRGSVKNAWDALRLADNADSVISDIANDPKMDTTRMQNILSAEVAKLAGGGAATEAGQRDIRPPDTVRAGLATMWEKISSNPTPAGLRNFALQLKPYLGQLRDNAQKRVGESLVNVRNGYKGRVNEDALKDFDDQYGQYIDSYKKMKTGGGGAEPSSAGSSAAGYSPAQESGIQKVMGKNPGATRDQVIAELKKAGKL